MREGRDLWGDLLNLRQKKEPALLRMAWHRLFTPPQEILLPLMGEFFGLNHLGYCVDLGVAYKGTELGYLMYVNNTVSTY